MKKVFMIGLAAAMLSACGDDGGTDRDDFDRTALLQNLADNIIVPAYEDAAASAVDLYTATQVFVGEPTMGNLNSTRTEFANAYSAWQRIGLFEFGPADNSALRSNINTYPVNTANVATLIASGSYDLDAISNVSSKGLPAIDYLLYGIAPSDMEILALYSTDPDAQKYRNFLSDVASDILARVLAVDEAWQEGYAADFKASTGNTIGSSIGLFLNAYILHYERYFRTLKLGLPAGVFSLEGDVFPEEAEAYFSGISVDLILDNFDQLERVFNGIGVNAVDGPGIDDYLDGVGASELRAQIQARLAAIGLALTDLSSPLTEQLVNDRETVLEVYSEVQLLVALLKADMASALSLQITYTDNDGD